MQVIVNISDEEEKILLNDLFDINEWVQDAVKGKINNCRKRLIGPYKSPLIDKTDSELVELVLALPDYKNRANREKE